MTCLDLTQTPPWPISDVFLTSVISDPRSHGLGRGGEARIIEIVSVDGRRQNGIVGTAPYVLPKAS